MIITYWYILLYITWHSVIYSTSYNMEIELYSNIEYLYLKIEYYTLYWITYCTRLNYIFYTRVLVYILIYIMLFYTKFILHPPSSFGGSAETCKTHLCTPSYVTSGFSPPAAWPDTAFPVFLFLLQSQITFLAAPSLRSTGSQSLRSTGHDTGSIRKWKLRGHWR